MKKLLLPLLLTVTIMASTLGLNGQTPSTLLDNTAVTTPGMHPLNASSSVLVCAHGITPVEFNLYAHSWDPQYLDATSGGIGWRLTYNTSDATLNSGFVPIPYASDIDIVFYRHRSTNAYYLLAAFYYDDGSTKGHYYNIYQFVYTGLTPVSTMNLLYPTAAFGRINVDAGELGAAITWCVPGAGIYTRAAMYSGTTLTFGPPVPIPGTAGYKDPDVCINNVAGVGRVHLAYRSNTETEIIERSILLSTITGGSTSGMTTQLLFTAAAPEKVGEPRIDCPDFFGTEKWVTVFSRYSVVGASVTESIMAGVWNGGYMSSPAIINAHTASFTGSHALNRPVVAYNTPADIITIGWITKNNTMSIPGYTDHKFVARDLYDPVSGPVSVMAGTYRMISDLPGVTNHPVLAFSNENSGYTHTGPYHVGHRLHAVYSTRTPSPITYYLMYKDKMLSSLSFRPERNDMAAETDLSVFPNPVKDKLFITIPAKGTYAIILSGIDGRTMYRENSYYEPGQQLEIDMSSFAAGIYLLHIASPENQVDFAEKIVK